MEIPTLPFKILGLGPFKPRIDRPWDDQPLRVDRTDLDEVIKELGLELSIPLPKHFAPLEALTLIIGEMKDFHPDHLLEKNPYLRHLWEAREFLKEAIHNGLSSERISQGLQRWPDLPPGIKIPSLKEKEAPEKSRSGSIENILEMVALSEERSVSKAESQVSVTSIDSLFQEIFTHLFSHDPFRNLESIWQGLKFLLQRGSTAEEVTIKIVPVTKETLEETLDHLMPRLIEDLPSLILFDLSFDHSPRSMELLGKIATFSETLLVPGICWITPKFLNLDNWNGLERLPFLPHYFDEPGFAKWRRLRKMTSARWLTLACNRFLTRFPYGPDNQPKKIYFMESENLWTSPVWGIGSLISQSITKRGWPTRFTEWREVRLEDLPFQQIGQDQYLPTEALIGEERVNQFVRAGIFPLVSPKNKDIAFTPSETTAGGSSLRHQLFLSRITQFLFWCNEHFPKGLQPADLEDRLEKALLRFCERSGPSSQGRVDVSVQSGTDRPATVKILIVPSPEILPTGEKLELELPWRTQ